MRQRFQIPRPILAALASLVVLGAALRLHGVGDSILMFHPTRQYRSAIIARALYFDSRGDLPDWVRKVSSANRGMQPAGEPPFLEWVAVQGYRWLGHENLAIPRAVSALAWVAAAVPLFLLTMRLASPAAALVGAALYLFLPYAVIASRAFQPDPLMTACVILALWMLVRNYERRTGRSVAAAAIAIAAAAVVKPMSIFLTVPVAVTLAIARGGVLGAMVDRQLILMLGTGLLPGVLYYGYSTLFGTLARDQWQMRFVPSLLPTSFFWGGLLRQVRRVYGVPLFLIGIAGAFVARERAARALLAGLWLGYALFAVAFTYHVPTHDYYHLPFVVAASVGAAVVVDRLLDGLRRMVGERHMTALAMVLAAGIAAGGTITVWPALTVDGADERIRQLEEIGTLAAHDARVLFLDHEYGYPLMYHAQVSGDSWPSADDLTAEALGGEQPIDAETRFRRDFEGYRPDYFIVTDLDSFDRQPDLQRLLDRRATLLAATKTYRVYRFLGNGDWGLGIGDYRKSRAVLSSLVLLRSPNPESRIPNPQVSRAWPRRLPFRRSPGSRVAR